MPSMTCRFCARCCENSWRGYALEPVLVRALKAGGTEDRAIRQTSIHIACFLEEVDW
jgi:hypothetical protein